MTKLQSTIFTLALEILDGSIGATKSVFLLTEKLVLAGFRLDQCLYCQITDDGGSRKPAFLRAFEEVTMTKYVDQVLGTNHSVTCGPMLVKYLVELHRDVVANTVTNNEKQGGN